MVICYYWPLEIVTIYIYKRMETEQNGGKIGSIIELIFIFEKYLGLTTNK